jgi:branched-chain amino acid transport system substrate-binding protein
MSRHDTLEIHAFQVLMRILIMFLAVSVVCSAQSALCSEIIRIGAIMPPEEPLISMQSHMIAGLKDCAVLSNLRGGINGKKVEVVVESSAFGVHASVEALDRLMDTFNPSAILGNSSALGVTRAERIAYKYHTLFTSATFSKVLAAPRERPSLFVAGPTYEDQFEMLLRYLAEQAPKSKVAFFVSDDSTGKEPLEHARRVCKALELELAAEITVNMKKADVSAEIIRLASAAPDTVIFHGFVTSPIPHVVKSLRDLGLSCRYMGTYLSSTNALAQELRPIGIEYFAINPYCYWWMRDVPMLDSIRTFTTKNYPDVEYRPTFYFQSFVSGLIFLDAILKADTAGRLNYEGLTEALQSIDGMSTRGLTAPLTIRNNRFPTARIWKTGPDNGEFVPITDWITIGE